AEASPTTSASANAGGGSDTPSMTDVHIPTSGASTRMQARVGRLASPRQRAGRHGRVSNLHSVVSGQREGIGTLPSMKAPVLHAVREPLVVEDVQLDEPRAGEVLVRMAASGVCHSCLHAAAGSWAAPLTPMVVVDAAADVDGEGR